MKCHLQFPDDVSQLGVRKPTHRRHPGWQINGGFTVLELLVVIGILGILMALLIPSLSKTKEKGKQTRCVANLHQLSIATQLYISQFESFPGHKWSVGDGKSDRWPVAIASELKAEKFLICPSTPEWKIGRNNPYGYNYKYLGSLRSNSKSPTAPHERFPVKSVQNPSKTIVYADSDGTGWTQPYASDGEHVEAFGNHAYTLDPTFIPKFSMMSVNNDGRPEAYSFLGYRTYISTRHNGGSGASWADGHVEKVTPAQVYQDNRYWNGYGEEISADVHVDHRVQDGVFRFQEILK